MRPAGPSRPATGPDQGARPRRRLLTPAGRRLAVAAIVVGSVAFAVLAVLVHDAAGATGFDVRALRWLYFHLGPSGAQITLETSNKTITITGVAFAAAACLLWRRVDAAALVVIAPAVSLLLTEEILKPLIGRRVPTKGIGSGFDELSTYAFPSGHIAGLTGLTASVAIVLLRAPIGRLGRALGVALLAVWTVLGAVGLTRNFYHYATDTIGGVLVGTVCALGIAVLIDAVAASRHTRVS